MSTGTVSSGIMIADDEVLYKVVIGTDGKYVKVPLNEAEIAEYNARQEEGRIKAEKNRVSGLIAAKRDIMVRKLLGAEDQIGGMYTIMNRIATLVVECMLLSGTDQSKLSDYSKESLNDFKWSQDLDAVLDKAIADGTSVQDFINGLECPVTHEE